MHYGDDCVVDAVFAFSDILSWARAIDERLDRRANGRALRRQGLIPALKPKRLRRRVEALHAQLQAGPFGEVRFLANFTLHGSLIRNPWSGFKVDTAGQVIMPIPDVPSAPVHHWYQLEWANNRDGVIVAEEIWDAIQSFMDGLLDAFEKATPKRLRV
jgi:hypothetical protein